MGLLNQQTLGLAALPGPRLETIIHESFGRKVRMAIVGALLGFIS
jgi:hypothetical protein